MPQAKRTKTKPIRVTKRELSDAGEVLQSKTASKKERTIAALLLNEARKKKGK